MNPILVVSPPLLRVSSRRCGADTRVCRVETRLDAFRVGTRCAEGAWNHANVIAWLYEKRRDESRRGRHECPRHGAFA
jgi:hypothetical protein